MAQDASQLCQPGTVAALGTARESVEQYLKNTLDEIKQLQESEQYLDNVDEVQQRSHDVEIWKVQREQLTAVEQCAKTCSCDTGALFVVQEYNSLARKSDVGTGLVRVPMPQSGLRVGLIVVVAAMVIFGVYTFLRRRRLT